LIAKNNDHELPLSWSTGTSMVMWQPSSVVAPPVDGTSPSSSGLLSECRRHLDLVVLLLAILVDIRLLQGTGAPASFTLFELVIWLYCLPWLGSRFLAGQLQLRPAALRVAGAFSVYFAWTLFAAVCAVVWRDSSATLQMTKNVAPSLVLVVFLAVRLREARTALVLGDLYVVWAFVSCLMGLLQFASGGPYLKPLVLVTIEKLGLDGELVQNPVVGFMTHPNAFAISILPGLMIMAAKLAMDLRYGLKVRLWDLLLLSVTVLGFVLAQSKGALAWATAAFVVCVLVPRPRGPLARFLLLGGLNTAITLYSLHQAGLDPTSGFATVETRVLLWQTARQALEYDSYVAILGDGMAYMFDWSVVIASWAFPSAHSGWVDQVVMFGFPGFFFYTLVFWVFFSVMSRSASPRGLGTEILGRAAEASVLAYCGLSLFEPTAADAYFVSQLTLLMMLGTATVGARLNE
jgi:hypothetical protein